MPKHQIVIGVNQEPGKIPELTISAPELTGPDLLYHLRNVCDIIHTQVIAATVKAQIAKEFDLAPSKGGIVIPGLVQPRDLRG